MWDYLGINSYHEYFQTDWWKHLKKRYIKWGSKCYICGSRYSLLLHHLSYNNLGREKILRIFYGDVVVVCFEHHKDLHYVHPLFIFKVKLPLKRFFLIKKLFWARMCHDIMELDIVGVLYHFILFAFVF